MTRRVVLAVPTLLLVSVLIFVLMRVVPGDTAVVLGTTGESSADPREVARLRADLGLNKPLPVQYMEWMGNVLRLDLGSSAFSGRSVASEIGERLPRTAELGLLSLALAIAFGTLLGVLSAVRRNKPEDMVIRAVAVSGVSFPVFWFGLVALVFVSRTFHWIPPLRFQSLWTDPGTNLSQMMLPALVIGFYQMTAIARLTRSAMLEVLTRDFIRTARAKGLNARVVLSRHALRNAALPVVTVIGAHLAHLLSGALVIEQIFAIPGTGMYLYQAVQRRDYAVVQGVVLMYAVVVVVVNLLVDLLYMKLDPRVRSL